MLLLLFEMCLNLLKIYTNKPVYICVLSTNIGSIFLYYVQHFILRIQCYHIGKRIKVLNSKYISLLIYILEVFKQKKYFHRHITNFREYQLKFSKISISILNYYIQLLYLILYYHYYNRKAIKYYVGKCSLFE